jgi:Resolvase, N terminal domain
MSAHLVGYARCSTDEQDLTAQRERLRELGVAAGRVYLDHGLTGTKRVRPGLDQALAAVREGNTLVVTKLDRLARSVPDARAIGDDLAARGIKLSLSGQIYDPADPMGKMFFPSCRSSPSSRPTCCGCAPRRAWPSPARKGNCGGGNPNSQPGSSTSCARCMPPASTPSPTSPSCSPSPAPRSTEHCDGKPDLNSADRYPVKLFPFFSRLHIRWFLGGWTRKPN